eukprot:TCONS_00043996-protein
MADDGSKILRFTSDTASPKHQEPSGKKYQATAKYDRKALKKRLVVEEWLHYELRRLYQCKEGEEYGVEIDLDILLQEKDGEKQQEMLQNLLSGSKEPVEEFIQNLLEKIKSIFYILK